MLWLLILMDLSVDSSAFATVMAEVNNNRTMTNPAVEKVSKPVVTVPTRSACAARPASKGPVHPKPAMRYPNPYRTWLDESRPWLA